MSISQEQRSFAPRRGRKGAAEMKREPLPDHPDNATLGRAIREVEECVHETGQRLSAEIGKHRTSTDKRLARLNGRLAKMEKQHAGFAKAIGVNEKGEVVRRSPMMMGRWEAIATLGGVVTVAVGFVQLVAHMWPAIALGAAELWAWLVR